MEILFEDKVVVVTGGAGGFGSATARAFGEAGAHVVVSDLNLEGAEQVAGKLKSGLAVQTDVTDEASIEGLLRRTTETFGGVDVLVNNAGAPNLAGSVEEIDVETLRWLTAINYESVVLASKFAIPHLRRRPGASIVNVASISAKRPRPGHAVYCSTKAGVEALTRALGLELAPDVRVNAVSPAIAETGFVKNAMGSDRLSESQREAMIAGIPMARTAQPDDVANAILYLASDRANFLTGVCLDVDGGRSI